MEGRKGGNITSHEFTPKNCPLDFQSPLALPLPRAPKGSKHQHLSSQKLRLFPFSALLVLPHHTPIFKRLKECNQEVKPKK